MLFDLHLHSRYSIDALTKPETIVRICKKNNLGFSLTDHNNMGAYKGTGNIKQLAKKEGVFLVPGEEISIISDKNSKKCVGEIIAYFLQEPIVGVTFQEAIDEIKRQDAIMSCPHPFDWPRKNFKEFSKYWRRFSCVETYNARAYYQGLNKLTKDFVQKEDVRLRIACLGVSDAHTPEEIGNGLTEINAINEDEFRFEIKKCRTRVIENKKASIWCHLQTQLAKRHLISER